MLVSKQTSQTYLEKSPDPLTPLTCDDDGLSRHGSVASTCGASEERVCEEQVAPQQHGRQQQQLKHAPAAPDDQRLTAPGSPGAPGTPTPGPTGSTGPGRRPPVRPVLNVRHWGTEHKGSTRPPREAESQLSNLWLI